VEVTVPDHLPRVQGDADLLRAILRALLDNALEALPASGGRVRVDGQKSPDSRAVWITVSDNGPGIGPDDRLRLFQPFFTTKTGHRGLGLARARRHAEWHHGQLDLQETGPGGSAFRLTLPATEVEA
jgi:signal transduction histidine kinase